MILKIGDDPFSIKHTTKLRYFFRRKNIIKIGDFDMSREKVLSFGVSASVP